MTIICAGCSEEIEDPQLWVRDRRIGTFIWSGKTFYFHNDLCLANWANKRADNNRVKREKQE